MGEYGALLRDAVQKALVDAVVEAAGHADKRFTRTDPGSPAPAEVPVAPARTFSAFRYKSSRLHCDGLRMFALFMFEIEVEVYSIMLIRQLPTKWCSREN